MSAYANGMHLGLAPDTNPLEVALDYCDTVNHNIAHFIKDRKFTMKFALENAKEDWAVFWERIGARGDLAAALSEWEIAYNK